MDKVKAMHESLVKLIERLPLREEQHWLTASKHIRKKQKAKSRKRKEPN
jgi:hypothetical protein